jgi:hypothetical protein
MKISRLSVTNCLGIKSFAFNPGRVNLIKGANESNKTSILEIIEKGIKNNSRRVEFVRKGEDQGEIFIELDNGLSIDRKINANGKDPQPKVVKDGFRATAAEGMLKALTGGDQFNPVDFLLKKDQEQTKVILGLVPLNVTVQDCLNWFGEVPPVNLNVHALIALNAITTHYYEKRRDQNLLVSGSEETIKVLFKQLPDNYNPESWREAKVSDIFSEIEKANTLNEQIDKATLKIQEKDKNRQAILDSWAVKISNAEIETERRITDLRQRAQNKMQEHLNDLTEIDRQIKALLERKSEIELNMKAIDQKLESLTQAEELNKKNTLQEYLQIQNNELASFDATIQQHKDFLASVQPIDVLPLREKASEVEKMKGYLPIWDSIQIKNKDHAGLVARAAELDKFVKLSREKPAELMATAELPIPGLGIDKDGNITIDDLPIRNHSTSKIMRMAVQIAKKTCGELKIICLDRFEALDPVVQDAFFDEIKDDDYQYFITDISRDYDQDGKYLGDLRVETRE